MEYLFVLFLLILGWLLIAYSRQIADFFTLVFTKKPEAPPPPAPHVAEPPAPYDHLQKKIEELIEQNKR